MPSITQSDFYKDAEALPYYRVLDTLSEELYRILGNPDDESGKIFPFARCNDSTRAVFSVTGLRQAGGHFHEGRRTKRHAWNYDPERGLFIDLTLGQFGMQYPEIAVISETTRGLVRDARLTKRQGRLVLPDAELVVSSVRRILQK